MEASQIIGLVIASITLVGGMVIALTAIKIAVPKSYEQRLAAMENQSRERIALIEEGADPSLLYKKEKKASGDPLFWGLLLIGIGFGGFYGSMVWHNFGWASEGIVINSSATFFGGIGLVCYHIICKLSDRKKAQ